MAIPPLKIEATLFLTLFFFLFSSPSAAVDFLTSAQNLTDGGATLVSEKGVFELGFFSPGNSTNRYLGIWYKIIPIRTIVWVANRENPVTDSSTAVFKINATTPARKPVLLQNGVVLWSGALFKNPLQDPKLQLLDNGNLVLKDAKSEAISWQSFDYPTDTLLPGMKLGWDFEHGINRRLSAWKTADDPSPGSLTMEMMKTNYPEPAMFNGSKEFMRSGPWNGLRLSGKHTSAIPIFVDNFANNKSELTYGYDLINSSLIGRMVLNQTTFIREILMWSESKKNWKTYAIMPRDICDTFGLCGAFGSCNIEEPVTCQCLKGFHPKVEEKWNLFDYSDGCMRNRPLNCSDKIGFRKIPELKLPDTKSSWVNESMNLNECREECSRKCSCVAFANTDIRGNGSGCAIWFGELFDIKFVRRGGQDLYVRMLASELETKKMSSVVVRIIVGATILMIASLSSVGFYIIRSRRRSIEGKDDLEGQEEDLELPIFDLTTISNATHNFSNSNKLGEGGFGAVFRGKFADGQEIAVKRLSSYSRQGTDEFKNEVILIAKLQHRNLVKLLGCCIQAEEKMLIYEYMPNKSLDIFIFDPARKKLLDWSKRFNIICGIARGILYLHQDSRLRIIHRDLKASNVLLDIDLNPKISDFGMARTFEGDQIEGNTKRVVGTYGYMAPEYAIGGQFSIKSDVFSFGILMLEIICGEKNRGFYRPNYSLNLIGHAWKLWNKGKSLELIDATIDDSCSLSEVVRCIHVSLLCLQQLPEDRPTMSNVVQMLSSERPLAQPTQPGFCMERDKKGDCLEGKNESSTINGLTITQLDAR